MRFTTFSGPFLEKLMEMWEKLPKTMGTQKQLPYYGGPCLAPMKFCSSCVHYCVLQGLCKQGCEVCNGTLTFWGINTYLKYFQIATVNFVLKVMAPLVLKTLRRPCIWFYQFKNFGGKCQNWWVLDRLLN